jgi:ABC-type transporter Mla subunit MlaD
LLKLLKVKARAEARASDSAQRDSREDVAALKQRIAMLESAVDNAPIAIAVYDSGDVLRVWNSAYSAVYRDIWDRLPQPVTYPDLVRESIRKQVDPAGLEAEVARRVALQHQADGKIQERRYGDGVWRRVMKVRTAGGGVAGFALDIDELRAREEQLRESKAELAQMASRTVPEAVAGFSRIAGEVIATMDEVKQLAGESSERAIATGAAAEELAVTITHVSGAMKDTAEGSAASSGEAAAMVAQIEKLGEALARVNAFADMIRGIAAQTNLLALNATIEAARAGEAGRGFSVVAAEVKALSKQTGDATAEIAAQVAAVEALMSEARATTARIGGSLQAITDKAADVASAVQQQRDAAEAVSSHMSDIIGRGRDTAEAANRALGRAEMMAASAQQLESTVREALAKVA